MATCIALLRGVNVGGNMLKMERVRELWSELGFTNVRTYVQSGNLIFQADGSPSRMRQRIEKKLVGQTRLPVAVVLRTSAEVGRVIARNPFLKDKTVDPSTLHVTFLGSTASIEAVKKLGAIKAGPDEFRIRSKEIYLHCPVGYGNTKLSNNAIQKALGVTATTRNWKTVNKLFEMASGDRSSD